MNAHRGAVVAVENKCCYRSYLSIRIELAHVPSIITAVRLLIFLYSSSLYIIKAVDKDQSIKCADICREATLLNV